MRKFSFLSKVLAVVTLGMFMASCGSELDPVVAVTNTPTSAVNAGEVFNISVKGTVGTAQLKTLQFLQDGQVIDAARLSGDVASGTHLITGADKDGFTYSVGIKAHDSGSATYEVVLTDDNGKTDNETFTVDVIAEDLTLEVVNGTPSITLTDAPPVKVMFTLKASGGGALTTLSVTDGDGNAVSTDDLYWGDANTNFSANPMPLAGDDVNGFEKSFWVRANKPGMNNFKVEVTDDNGTSASVDLVVNLAGGLQDTSGVIMWNADGPKKGSVDLNTFTTVSSSSADRDLMDSGIDGNGNWIQKIKAVKGAQLVMAAANADFNNIQTAAQIETMFNNGTAVSETPKLDAGMIFTVKVGSDYFAVMVMAANATSGDNLDNYSLRIKG